MYKACIFDLDGTLTDTLESLVYSVNKTLEFMGLRSITHEQCRVFVGNGARYLLERSLEAAGAKPERIEEAMEAYKRIFGKNCTYHVTPYEGVPEMLDALKKKGMKLAVLSNKPHSQTVDVVNTFFEEGTFAHIQGQREEIRRKPAPDGVFFTAEKLGVEPSECIYIGDSEVDVRTGLAADVKTVAVTWGFRSQEVLKEAGAVHIIGKPEELLSLL